MPIRAEFRHYYNTGWRRLRLERLAAAGYRCANCRRWHPLLNLAHLSHDPTSRMELEVLCPSCHAKNDTRQRVAMTRRTRAARRGQLWLSEELRWAPYPAWAWPGGLQQPALFDKPDVLQVPVSVCFEFLDPIAQRFDTIP